MQVQVLMLRQDDPKKCTAAKLVKFGLAVPVKKTNHKTLILDPFAKNTLLPRDKKSISSIAAIDCSWDLADDTFAKNFLGMHRKLPPLLAGNPVNYSKLGKLTTVEAIASAVIIFGYKGLGIRLLDKFKWGHTFYELNANLLSDYAKLDSEEQIAQLLHEYAIIPQ